MEKKQTNDNKNVMFQNLKQLNSIISGKDINVVFANIKTAKLSIDSFCKKVKEQILKNDVKIEQQEKFKTAVVENVVQKPVEQTQPSISVQEKSSTKTFNPEQKPQQNTDRKMQQPNNYARSNNSDGFNRNKPNAQYNNYNKRPDSGQQYLNSNYNRKPDSNAQYPNSNYNRRPDSNSQYSNSNYNKRPDSNAQYTRRNTDDSKNPSFPNKKPFSREQVPFNRNDKSTFVNKNKTDKGNIISFTAGAGRTNKPKTTTKPSAPIVIPGKSQNFGQNKNKSKSNDGERKSLSIKEKMRLGYVAFDHSLEDDREVVRIKSRKHKELKQQEKTEITHVVITEDVLTIKILSEKIGKPASDIIKKFLILGLMYNINSVIDFSTAELIASEFGITLERKVDKSYEEKLIDLFDSESVESESEFVKRPPIITVMGHVDHGKTSLLDYIKKSHVVLNEAGGITQHIGAYSINVKTENITFIDTPGHAAFSEMRARGATVADIAILIIAADDGVMPQTVEAIKHIKEAKIPMIVAINKIDKPAANVERIKQQLTKHDVLIEEWGGDVICVPISAHSGEGIDKLLEMILLVAEINDFKANPNAMALGTCLESKVDTGRGIIATIIVKDGTLRIGDYVVCGLAIGRIRAMTNYKGESVKEALPSMAVSVVGLNSVPNAGDMAYVVDEKFAKNVILERSNKLQVEKIKQSSGVTLEEFLSQSSETEIKTFKVIVKADVQGTSEALKQTLEAIKNEEVTVNCISYGVGMINENDILLAKSSNVQIIGFNTKIDAKAKALAERNGVIIKQFKVIYDAVDYVTGIVESMKSPKYKESIIGKVEVRQLFKISSLGVIAGSYVLEGVINRNSLVRVLRNNVVVADTVVDTLQQQKDESKQVKSGFECGIKLKGFNDIKVGDILVVYENVKI